MTENKEELKSLLMRVIEESEIYRLETQYLKKKKQKTKIMASCPITSCQLEGANVAVVTGFLFFSSKITAAMKLEDNFFLA